MSLKDAILRCLHRHTIDEHPNCYLEGSVNQVQATDLYEKNGKPWYQLDGLRVGYLDIETDNLRPDFGTILSWCIKEKDGPVTYDVIKKEELFDGTTDQRILDSLINEMMKYKIIVTYYGSGFDVPFVRSKAMHYNKYFPGYINEIFEDKLGNSKIKVHPELFHFDLFYVVKSKMLLSRYSLDNACDYLGIEGKTPLSKSVWRKAKYGDPEALSSVLEHNIGDVEILEELHNRLVPFAKWIKKPL